METEPCAALIGLRNHCHAPLITLSTGPVRDGAELQVKLPGNITVSRSTPNSLYSDLPRKFNLVEVCFDHQTGAVRLNGIGNYAPDLHVVSALEGVALLKDAPNAFAERRV